MPAKTGGKHVYKSLQGKMVDIDMLRQKNELTPAIGNMRVNARGDEIGRGGKIVRSREAILKDYYKAQPGMPSETIAERPQLNQQPAEPQPIVEEAKQTKSTSSARSKKKEEPVVEVEAPTQAEKDEWEETADGDFIKKEK